MVAGSVDNAEPHERQLTEHHLYTQTPTEHCRPYNTSTITLHACICTAHARRHNNNNNNYNNYYYTRQTDYFPGQPA